MNSLQKSWIREVQRSRIITPPGDEAYVKGIDLKVWDVVHSIASGLGENQLIEQYPTLTKADIRACSLFVYLQAIGRI